LVIAFLVWTGQSLVLVVVLVRSLGIQLHFCGTMGDAWPQYLLPLLRLALCTGGRC
jgi:hypothetical protein